MRTGAAIARHPHWPLRQLLFARLATRTHDHGCPSSAETSASPEGASPLVCGLLLSGSPRLSSQNLL